MADYPVGSDVGTGGTQSVLIDTEGQVLGSHFIFSQPGGKGDEK